MWSKRNPVKPLKHHAPSWSWPSPSPPKETPAMPWSLLSPFHSFTFLAHVLHTLKQFSLQSPPQPRLSQTTSPHSPLSDSLAIPAAGFLPGDCLWSCLLLSPDRNRSNSETILISAVFSLRRTPISSPSAASALSSLREVLEVHFQIYSTLELQDWMDLDASLLT